MGINNGKERLKVPKKIDLTGMTFGRLTVISESSIRKQNNVCWNCL